jgi:hypothetical protein
MRKFLSVVLASVFFAGSLSPVAVQAAGFPTILGASKAEEAKIENVHRRHYRHHRHYRGYNTGAAVAAGIIGLGVGAAIASQPRYYDEGPVYRDRDYDAYCFSKYKSYDPRTGTYLGYDGYRHPCR